MQAIGTLLGWLEATGHRRLWQLTSLMLRPAWIAMAAAAAARPAAGLRSPLDAELMEASLQEQQHEQHSSSSSSSRLALAGSFQLLCPDPWQQQLVHLLVQQPSEQGLLKLLQLLPGMLLSELQLLGLQAGGSSSTASQQQQQQDGIEPRNNSRDDALNSSQLLVADGGGWPSTGAWQQQRETSSSSSPNNKQLLFGPAGTARHDMLQVSFICCCSTCIGSF
jgi:hypothetical protein